MVGETVADLILGIGERVVARAQALKAAEQAALADTKADLQRLDQVAAAAPDALRAGDARVDSGQPAPEGVAP